MKRVLLEQFAACYDEDEWFVALRTALDGVTEEVANWKPDGVDNSIRGLVNHTIFWNERWLQRYRGELSSPPHVENDGTFESEGLGWQETVDKLWSVLDDWRVQLKAMTDERLLSSVSADYMASWHSPLAHQNIHNAYHTGQIVLMRKLQGAWDPSKGVS